LGLGLRLAQLASVATNHPRAVVSVQPFQDVRTALGDDVTIDLQVRSADLVAVRLTLDDFPLNAVNALEVVQNHRVDVRAAAQVQRQLGVLTNLFHVRISSSPLVAGSNILLLIYSIDKYF
jgi:hypothetical protein